MSRKLIVNADDLGFNREVTDGILDSHQNGVVTSTTLMVNMPAADYAVSRIADYPDLSVGIHLNLTSGTPVCDPNEIPSIVDSDGKFLNHLTFMRRANRFQCNATDIERELSAQLDRFESYGVKPTHADSHHHSTYCLQVFPVLLKLLKKYGLNRMRSHRGWYHRDRTASNRTALRLKALMTNLRRFPQRMYYEVQHIVSQLRGFKAPDERYDFYKVVGNHKMGFERACIPGMVSSMPSGVLEFVCHPGYLSDDPNRSGGDTVVLLKDWSAATDRPFAAGERIWYRKEFNCYRFNGMTQYLAIDLRPVSDD